MNRKEIAEETLRIQRQGFYEYIGNRVDAYYDKYPNLKDLIDPDTMEMMRATDGHVYGMPSWFGSSRNENQMASSAGLSTVRSMPS